MATVTIDVTAEQESALRGALDKLNFEIDARNRKIQADKDLQASLGNDYVGPEPAPLLTYQDIVQMRFNERVSRDVVDRTRVVADELAKTFMSATPEEQAAMMEDMAKYRRTEPAPHRRPK